MRALSCLNARTRFVFAPDKEDELMVQPIEYQRDDHKRRRYKRDF